ncbi:MAG TPA: DUF72 domain-containing protein [Gemmatimonadales bacterium]
MSPSQPSLFDDEPVPPAPPAAPERPDLERLAHSLPRGIRFGTSTWTYDGWTGDVYHRSYRGPQPARRLEEYARYPLFRTVGIDSAFYEPLSEDVLRAYARALPPGFGCVTKVWDRITAKRLSQDPRWGPLAGLLNPDFLSADLFKEQVLGPHERVFKEHVACFVLEFQAMRGKDLPDPTEWADQLHDFLRQLPKGFRYAVELRNPGLLTDLHGAVLREHGAAHVFNSWTEMPPIGAQLDLEWTFPAGFTVARALLKPGRAYADAVKLFEPYDRVREKLGDLRADLVRLVVEAQRRRLEAFILANNRAEGYAPGTIRAVVEKWQELSSS